MSPARILMIVGGALFLIGLLLSISGPIPIGRLPGDLVVRRGNFTLYFPIVTSILLSIVLTVILWLFRR